MHDVNWNIVTLPNELGRLGLGNLEDMNNACILKRSWKLISESDDLWCKVLIGIYKDVNLLRTFTYKSYGSCV